MAATIRLARTAFPEREDKDTSAPDLVALRLLARLRGWFARPAAREVARLAAALDADGAALRALDDQALRAALKASAPAATRDLDPAALRRALLLAGEVARRTLGMQPYPAQLFGAMTLLRGQLAEMQTGEGKTLTAGVAACIAGAAGVPVHVVTVNDYLAGRDAESMGPLLAFAGLGVGVIRHGIEREERARAYACDVTYCTNKELVFDYLRDRVAARGRASSAQLRARRLFGDPAPAPLLRGLHFAIVDEADSILVDEARTPLILAEKVGEVEYAPAFGQALELASAFQRAAHYELDAARSALRLTDEGRRHLARLTAGRPAPWSAAHAREHLVVQALRALHLFHRDRQYLIDDEGKVQIIDEYTGRVLPGRTWEQGLHQMIEVKEGVALSEQTQTLARITYQRFFCRYLRLAGMTGTAREMAGELAAVYRLETVTVPTHRPCVRVRLPDQLLGDEAQKWEAVARWIANRHARGQPVLIGTRSVEHSERLSHVLQRQGLVHAVLNARQDAAEAAIVARAGEPGAITVATNMAGRGTDIALGEGVAAQGGLCVVLTEFHESPRIDRQLFGRCARQGDPGSAIAIVALDDELFTRHGGKELSMLRAAHRAAPEAAARALDRVRAAAQARAERIHGRSRRDTLKLDRDLEQMMSIAGDPI
jgi:preprotein translocase subunit SecA